MFRADWVFPDFPSVLRRKAVFQCSPVRFYCLSSAHMWLFVGAGLSSTPAILLLCSALSKSVPFSQVG